MGKKPAAKAQEEAKKQETTTAKKAPKAPEPEASHHAHHASSKPREEQSCKIKKCKRGYKAKGYCTFHYKEWRNGKFGLARYKTCGQMDCRKPMTVNRHGYCEDHYQNIYVKGNSPKPVQVEEKKKEESAA